MSLTGLQVAQLAPFMADMGGAMAAAQIAKVLNVPGTAGMESNVVALTAEVLDRLHVSLYDAAGLTETGATPAAIAAVGGVLRAAAAKVFAAIKSNPVGYAAAGSLLVGAHAGHSWLTADEAIAHHTIEVQKEATIAAFEGLPPDQRAAMVASIGAGLGVPTPGWALAAGIGQHTCPGIDAPSLSEMPLRLARRHVRRQTVSLEANVFEGMNVQGIGIPS